MSGQRLGSSDVLCHPATILQVLAANKVLSAPVVVATPDDDGKSPTLGPKESADILGTFPPSPFPDLDLARSALLAAVLCRFCGHQGRPEQLPRG